MRFCEGGSRLVVETNSRLLGLRIQIVGDSAINFTIPGVIDNSSREDDVIKFPHLLNENDLRLWDLDGNRIGQASIEQTNMQILDTCQLALIDDRVADLNAFDNGLAVLEVEPLRSLKASAILESCSKTTAELAAPGKSKKYRLSITQNKIDVLDLVANQVVGSVKTGASEPVAIILPTMNRLLVGDRNIVRIFQAICQGSLGNQDPNRQLNAICPRRCIFDCKTSLGSGSATNRGDRTQRSLGRRVILRFEGGIALPKRGRRKEVGRVA